MLPVVKARLAALAVGAGLVVLVGPAGLWWLLAVDGLLLVAAVADLIRAPDPRRIDVERELPAVVRLGAATEVVWRVRNPTSRALRVALADELVPSLGAAARRARVSVPPGATVRTAATLHPVRRGRFRPPGITVRVDGPLGLMARQRRRALPGSLLVLPAFPSRRHAEVLADRAQRRMSGEHRALGTGGGTDFAGLREYTPDDEYRHVDWAATSRSRSAVVRTYRPERDQTVIVLVDAGRTMAGRIGDVPRLDHAMDAALALTTVATRIGDRVGLVAFDEQVRTIVPPRGRADQVRRLAESLAVTAPRLVEADYAGALSATLARFRRRALLVVLTDLAPGAVEQTLLPALPLVARDHLVLVAGIRDPDVTRWAAGEPAEAGTAFLAAAATTELDRRRDVVARVRRAAAAVVEEEPDRFAPAVAEAYLRLKDAGRL